MGRPKVPKVEITQEYLRSVLNYNTETGVFTWLKDGSIAGAPKDERGYVRITLNHHQRPYAHRLAFIYMTGQSPQCVDHVDLDKSNNRWANLRAADKSKNGMNRVKPKNNTSGFKGVYYQANGYVGEVFVEGKKHYVGRFSSPEDAARAVQQKRLEIHGEFARK